MDKVRTSGRKDEKEAAGAAAPVETERDVEGSGLEEELLQPKPPVKSKGRGGTGIGRDLDH